jgi:hypothetical protein
MYVRSNSGVFLSRDTGIECGRVEGLVGLLLTLLEAGGVRNFSGFELRHPTPAFGGAHPRPHGESDLGRIEAQVELMRENAAIEANLCGYRNRTRELPGIPGIIGIHSCLVSDLNATRPRSADAFLIAGRGSSRIFLATHTSAVSRSIPHRRSEVRIFPWSPLNHVR